MGRIFLLLISFGVLADPAIVKDLRTEWLQYTDNQYTFVAPDDTDEIKTIYFRLAHGSYKGQFLLITGSDEWNLFMNGALVFTGREHRMNLDSVDRTFPTGVFVGVHSDVGVSELRTFVVSPSNAVVVPDDSLMVRPSTFFRDYAILITAILMFFFILLLRTNPQLTLDYFTFAKIFSVQERNEKLLASRITSSENMLFYLFCALLTGFLLSVIFHFAGTQILTSRHIEIYSFGGAVIAWLKLSLFTLVLLAAKLIIVLIFSALFNFSETVSFQFFNFLRFVLFTAIVLAALSFIYFIFRGSEGIFYERLIVLGLILLSVGSVMVLIKLLARAPFSFFHLFSYLCASEIIPLVIIIKIFF